jgi:hypothetical protein
MRNYKCDYTWKDVNDAANRCLAVISNNGICDENRFLALSLNAIGAYVFAYGDSKFDENDLDIIKKAIIQSNAVGYIGKLK